MTSLITPTPFSPTFVFTKDPEYHWENACFWVEDCVFKVPPDHFVAGSEFFADKFSSVPSTSSYSYLPGILGLWQSAEVQPVQVVLEDVTADEFRTFLKLLFPRPPLTFVALTKEEWTTILKLSTLWRFNNFRRLAIEELDSQLKDPVDLVMIGRESFVARWVLDGYKSFISRYALISEDIAERIGYQTTVKLYRIRERIWRPHVPSNSVYDWIRSNFGEELRMLMSEEEKQGTLEQLDAILLGEILEERPVSDGTKKIQRMIQREAHKLEGTREMSEAEEEEHAQDKETLVDEEKKEWDVLSGVIYAIPQYMEEEREEQEEEERMSETATEEFGSGDDEENSAIDTEFEPEVWYE